ncbi:MAG: protein translocase subunit SecF [Acidobacteriota bacterium]
MQIFHNANFNFIKWRWHALVISLAIVWGGLGWMFTHGGMPMGVDFTGGTVIIAEFSQPTSEDAVRAALDPVSKDKVVQKYGNEPGRNRIMIRLPLMQGAESGTSLEGDAKKVEAALRAAQLPFSGSSKSIVGPQVGKDLQSKGIWALLTSLGGIMIYVAFRFRLTFAIGAVVATFHDIFITIVFLWLFHYDMSLNIIAAILTIAGYSVNDTIVVFDRVRENLRTMRREPLDEVVNKSVNQTLGRTIITSGVTFLAVLALYLFGGEVLRGFAFTMMIGVVTGTYSTVFIAAAIAIILSRQTPTQGAAASAKARTARA